MNNKGDENLTTGNKKTESDHYKKIIINIQEIFPIYIRMTGFWAIIYSEMLLCDYITKKKVLNDRVLVERCCFVS